MIAYGQYTIRDENDIDIGIAPPPNPVKDQLWLDTSVKPSKLKKWSGTAWEIVNDTGDIESGLEDAVETLKTHTTEINISKGNINTLIADTTIIKDGKTVKLKDEYNKTVATVDGMKNTISSHKTEIDATTGRVNNVESKTNILERDVSSMTSRLSSTESTVNNHTTQINTAQSTANSANSKADKAQVDANKGINDAKAVNDKFENLEIGCRNIIINSRFQKHSENNNLTWDKELNGNLIAENWSFYNGGVSNATTGYHAHLYRLENELVVRYMEFDRWKSATYILNPTVKKNIIKGQQYTYSFEVLSNSDGGYMYGGLYYFKENEDKASFHIGQYRFNIIKKDNWVKYVYTFTMPIDIDFSKTVNIYNYGDKIKGINYARKFMLEKGNKSSDHTDAVEDIQQQIDKNKNDIITVNTEVTTTKNKVSGIEQNIDSITTRVGSVENTTTTHSATINSHTSSINAVDGKINTAKTEAINTAKSDATTKANDAKVQSLNDAKNYTNVEVTKVVTSTNSKFAEIKTTTESITQSVSNTNSEVNKVKISATEANNKIDTLKFGGKNYISNGNFIFGTSDWKSLDGVIEYGGKKCGYKTRTTNSEGYIQTAKYNKENISTITLSFLAAATDNVTSFEVFILSRKIGSSSPHDYAPVKSFKLSKELKKYIWTYAFPEDVENYDIRFDNNGSKDGLPATLYITEVQLENGTKDSDFTQSANDVSKEILDITTEKVNQAKADIKITTDAISSKVTQVENTTTTINGKVTSHESRLAAAEQKITTDAIINTVVNSKKYQDDKGNVYTKSESDSLITQKADQITQTVSTVTKGNLISNGGFESGLKNWGVNGNIEANTDQNWQVYDGKKTLFISAGKGGGVYQAFKTVVGKKYVASFYAMMDGFGNDNTMIGIEDIKTVNTKDVLGFKKFIIEFTATKTSHSFIAYSNSNLSKFFLDNVMINEGLFALDFTEKVVKESNIVSSINQTAEAVKIQANKIQLEGAVTVGDSSGNYVKIENANYTILNNGQQRGFIGFKNMGNNFDKYVVPKLALGAYGYATNHNYFTIIPYRGGDNPQNVSNAYVDIAYHCISNDDWSNVKMYDGGDVRLAPLKNLEITTNYLNGSYAGTNERRLALFGTSSETLYNSFLQIGCIKNNDNGYGLVLADEKHPGVETRIRVTTTENMSRVVIPDSNGIISLGSSGLRWSNVWSNTLYNTDGVRSSRKRKRNRQMNDTEIIDNLEFAQVKNSNSKLIMDVSNITGSNYAPIKKCEETGKEVQVINMTELLKLALMEIKSLKNEMMELKTVLNV